MKRWIGIGILAIACSSSIIANHLQAEEIQRLNVTVYEQAKYIGYQTARIDELLVDIGSIGYYEIGYSLRGTTGLDKLDESISMLGEAIRSYQEVIDRLAEWNDYLAESIDKLEKQLDQLGVTYEPASPWPGIK